LYRKFGEIKPQKIAKLVEFTLAKKKKKTPISLLKNGEISPEKTKK
jgi:hypothetical protein